MYIWIFRFFHYLGMLDIIHILYAVGPAVFLISMPSNLKKHLLTQKLSLSVSPTSNTLTLCSSIIDSAVSVIASAIFCHTDSTCK